MKFLPYDKPHFLMPAHDHDPADVSNLTDLPLPVSGPLPKVVRELLPAVQEATSIVFASFNRLDNLLSQRLERLSVVRDENRNPDGEDVQCKSSILHQLRPPCPLVRSAKNRIRRLRARLLLVPKPGDE